MKPILVTIYPRICPGTTTGVPPGTLQRQVIYPYIPVIQIGGANKRKRQDVLKSIFSETDYY